MTRKRFLRFAWPALLGALVAVLSVSFTPESVHRIGPAGVSIGAELGWGRTVVEIPPFGSLRAKTHASPLELRVSLTDIDPRGLAELIETTRSTDRLIAELASGLRGAAGAAAIRFLFAGAIIGAAALALLPGRRVVTIATGALGGLAAMSITLGVAAATFDPAAFESPRFTGALERAPSILAAVQKQAGSFQKIPSRFESAAARLSDLMSLVSQPITSPTNDSVALLHISDIHSNPIGLEIAKQLAIQFDADAVIDTGDLTSFGAPIESRIGELIGSIPVPYLFVPGNHDSEGNREALGALPNVVMMDAGVVHDIAGVKVMGWPDPTFNSEGKLSHNESARIQAQHADDVASSVGSGTPHVLAVHHPDLGKASAGEVPVVLAGHGHLRRSRMIDGTLLLQVGSTGATGLGSFLVEADLAYEAEIVYFRHGKAIAVDYISFKGLGRDFEVERRRLDSEG